MKSLIFTVILLISFLSVNAQEDTKKSRKQCKEEKQAEQIEKIRNLIENKSFVFNARRAIPLAGEAVNLNYFYTVKVDNNKVVSYLPFYGTSYEEAYSIQNSPFDFTNPLTKFKVDKEKDKYIVSFSVYNNDNEIRYYFRISELGYTYLKVTSVQRQCISFQGMIGEAEPTVF